MEINFGEYSLPVILVVIMSLLFKILNDAIPKRFKTPISALLGIGLGLLAIPYKGLDLTIVNVVDHIFYGLMIGTSATGLYEYQKNIKKSNEP